MSKWRKKPIIVDATQWFKNGDHPEDESELIDDGPYYKPEEKTEGKVVRRWQEPISLLEKKCDHCGNKMKDHGWIATLEGHHIVCPGDFVITGIEGERYPCKPDIFLETYDKVKGEKE